MDKNAGERKELILVAAKDFSPCVFMKTKASTYQFLLFLTLPFIAFSCGLIPDLSCNIKMNSEYIESSCGLFNGVRFEELKEVSLDEDEMPENYRVVSAVELYVPQTPKNGMDKIYFTKSNGVNIWRMDTITNGKYRTNGFYRERVSTIVESENSIAIIEDDSSFTIRKYKASKIVTHPILFKSRTWYYVDFYDQRYEAYLYVNDNGNYQLTKHSLPTNF